MKRRELLPNSEFEDKVEELGRRFCNFFKQKAIDTLPDIEDKIQELEKELEDKRKQRDKAQKK